MSDEVVRDEAAMLALLREAPAIRFVKCIGIRPSVCESKEPGSLRVERVLAWIEEDSAADKLLYRVHDAIDRAAIDALQLRTVEAEGTFVLPENPCEKWLPESER